MIQTNKKSLKYLLEQKIATPDQQQWMVKLMGYDYEIRYRPGKENAAADALSRRTDSPTLNHLFVPQVSLWGEIKKAMHEDDYLKKIAQQAETQPDGPYTAKNGLIFFKGRVVVLRKMRDLLLFEAHNTKIGGHSGVLRTYKRLAQQFYWPSMFQSVHDYVSKCVVCQKTKSETLQPAGLLQPLPVP